MKLRGYIVILAIVVLIVAGSYVIYEGHEMAPGSMDYKQEGDMA